jgi:DNA (cytosine-5)-methyltransferase 1
VKSAASVTTSAAWTVPPPVQRRAIGRRRRRLVAIDFFCGAGGLTEGLRQAGLRVLAGVDNDQMLAPTYEANHGEGSFLAEDVTTLDIHELRGRLGIREHDVVLYAACTPCQPFSTLNQKRGVDDRKQLLLTFGRVVREAPPDYVLVENVPGLKNAYGRDIHLQFLKDLDAAGLADHCGGMLDAADYGVPQIRKRYLLLASAHGPISLPVRRKARRSVLDAIGDMPVPVEVGPPVLPNHVYRKPLPHHERILRAVPADGGSRADIADPTVLLQCHQYRPGVHKDVFGRMAWNDPAPTLTCRCTDVYCGRFAHPEQHRGLTVREAAALQTFPDEYEFVGSLFHTAKQIGNAVPVELARRLGLRIRDHARANGLVWRTE